MAKQVEYISVKEAAKIGGYNAEYLRQLLRAGHINGKVIVRDWLVDRDSLLEHMREAGRVPQKQRANFRA